MNAGILQHCSHDSAATIRARTSKQLWAGRIVTGLAVAFLVFDIGIKFSGAKAGIDGTTALGYSANIIVPLGIVQLLCLVVYLVPRTAPLGAVLWTGYLGGAVATHVRVGNPWASHILFPVYIAAFLWVGLFLRDARVRALLNRT